MKRRPYGNTGLDVSEIGFGAFQIGDEVYRGVMEEKEALSLLRMAYERGCNFYDTAPLYGFGKSEELLGKAFRQYRDKVVINTKCGHYADDGKDWDVKKIRKNLEKSLKRLQTDYIDSIILHNPPEEMLDAGSSLFELFRTLQKEGKIRFYGSSLDTSRELTLLMEKTGSSVSEILFHIFHQEPKKVFESARTRGIGLIGKVPLDSGWLSGKYTRHTEFTDVRRRWSLEDKIRREKLVARLEFLKEEGTMVQGALRFILSFPQISTVIPGFRTPRQIEECMADIVGSPLNDEWLTSLEELWNVHIRDNPLPW